MLKTKILASVCTAGTVVLMALLLAVTIWGAPWIFMGALLSGIGLLISLVWMAFYASLTERAKKRNDTQ